MLLIWSFIRSFLHKISWPHIKKIFKKFIHWPIELYNDIKAQFSINQLNFGTIQFPACYCTMQNIAHMQERMKIGWVEIEEKHFYKQTKKKFKKALTVTKMSNSEELKITVQYKLETNVCTYVCYSNLDLGQGETYRQTNLTLTHIFKTRSSGHISLSLTNIGLERHTSLLLIWYVTYWRIWHLKIINKQSNILICSDALQKNQLDNLKCSKTCLL